MAYHRYCDRITQEQHEEFKEAIRWLSDALSDRPPQSLLGYLRKAEKSHAFGSRASRLRDDDESSADEDSRPNPTPLMLAINMKSSEADWHAAFDIVFSEDDHDWKKTVSWTHPSTIAGPRGFSVMAMASNKLNGEQVLREKVLHKIFTQAIKGGFINQRMANGQTNIHLAINNTNLVYLKTLAKAEDRLIADKELPHGCYVNWQIKDDRGLTPLGKWADMHEHPGSQAKTGPLKDFLRDRMVDIGWSPQDIEDHLTQQRTLSTRLQRAKNNPQSVRLRSQPRSGAASRQEAPVASAGAARKQSRSPLRRRRPSPAPAAAAGGSASSRGRDASPARRERGRAAGGGDGEWQDRTWDDGTWQGRGRGWHDWVGDDWDEDDGNFG